MQVHAAGILRFVCNRRKRSDGPVSSMPDDDNDTTAFMPARLTGFIYLLVTATGWALNWPAMKVLLREWPPLFSRGVAGMAAAVLLGVIATFAGENIRVPRALVPR